MSKKISLEDIEAMTLAAGRLKKLLQDSPELLAFAEALKESRDPVLVITNDRLVRVGEAAEILGCNKNTIGDYCKRGLLEAYYTPGCFRKKFKLSDVWSLAKKADPEANMLNKASDVWGLAKKEGKIC